MPEQTPASVQSVVVTFSCPSCGAQGYEETFTGREVAAGTQASVPCDECPVRIAVDVDVRLQALAGTDR